MTTRLYRLRPTDIIDGTIASGGIFLKLDGTAGGDLTQQVSSIVLVMSVEKDMSVLF